MRCAWLMLQCREIFGNDCNYVIVSFLGNRVCFYETMFSTKTEVDARDQCVKWMITPPHSFCLTSLSYTFVLQGSCVLKQKKWGGVRRSPWKRKEDRRSILLYIFLLQTLSKKKKHDREIGRALCSHLLLPWKKYLYMSSSSSLLLTFYKMYTLSINLSIG